MFFTMRESLFTTEDTEKHGNEDNHSVATKHNEEPTHHKATETRTNETQREVEADETFIGGKARNMHISERKRRITGTGGKDKTAVMGILERGGKVRTTVIPSRKKKALQAEVRQHVEAGAALYTDALLSYEGLEGDYAHQVVDHAVQYVDGRVHTNGLENFWSLLKRGISGTYVSVEPFHLFRYLDEQTFRYNNRATQDNPLNDADRFALALSQIVGKRLTYQHLTGKDVVQPQPLVAD